MTWIIVAVVVVAVLFFLFSGSKNKNPAKPALPASSGNPTEDSRVLLDGLVQENRKRWAALPDSTVAELADAQRRDVHGIWDFAYQSAISDGKDASFATQVALLRVATFLIIGDDKTHEAFNGGLVLETLPFREMPADQAKTAAVEYFISKYNMPKANPEILMPALLTFGDQVLENSKSQADPDRYVYEMICRGTLDWQKYLAQAIADRAKGNA
ncbi:hypothetical protein ACCT07_32375 [Rhizobium johnstonii]|uniref:hypothetical protein n=1 Tax=Rhizobium johnstonii TaxID=3019933 RepID=UPI003F976398